MFFYILYFLRIFFIQIFTPHFCHFMYIRMFHNFPFFNVLYISYFYKLQTICYYRPTVIIHTNNLLYQTFCSLWSWVYKIKGQSVWRTCNINDIKPRLKINFSKLICLFIADISPPPQTTPEMKIKSSGTDDGFKGEAAKCGSSIIRVASQMVSGKVIQGFHISDNHGNCDEPKTLEKYDLMKRRGSKSLPASPLTSPGNSPKSNRKSINKYFTGAFTDVDKSKGNFVTYLIYIYVYIIYCWVRMKILNSQLLLVGNKWLLLIMSLF